MGPMNYRDLMLGIEDDDPLGLMNFPRKPGHRDAIFAKHAEKAMRDQMAGNPLRPPMPQPMTGGQFFPQNQLPPQFGEDAPNPFVGDVPFPF